MRHAAEYRQKAEECIKLAMSAATDFERQGLLKVAKSWEELAHTREESATRWAAREEKSHERESNGRQTEPNCRPPSFLFGMKRESTEIERRLGLKKKPPGADLPLRCVGYPWG